MVVRLVWLLILGLVLDDGLLYAIGSDTNYSTRPEIVNVGAIFTFNSTIGKVAKIAIQAAVDDVNSSPQVLRGTKLNISMQDCGRSGFLGIVEAMSSLENEEVAIIGPQSSVIAQVIAQVAKGIQVPLLSFAGTDPTLSSLEYPFFVRTTQSDLYQMTAIADMVDYFGWKEVTAIYTDDNFGRNAIASLGDKLAERQCRISYRAPMSPVLNREDILNVLFKVVSQESRILVLHTYDAYGLEILDVARSLHMLEEGYVWIATRWLTDVLDTDSPLSPSALDNVQGLLTLRVHTPDSELKRNFIARWSDLMREEKTEDLFGWNTYGLFAYDSVWILAHALDAYFDLGGNISFSVDPLLSHLRHGSLRLDRMKIFDGGNLLLSNVLKVNMTGLTGPIQFDHDRSLMYPCFDIINVVGTGHNTIGYWSNFSGLSARPPEVSYEHSTQTGSGQLLSSVIWPGESANKPRGWVFPNNGKFLRIAIPDRLDYGVFISYSSSTETFTGYCIDVFNAAMDLLPYAAPYKFIAYGDGKDTPQITELIEKMSAGAFDAVVGDISITTRRTRIADFTQPYMESGLVVVAPIHTEDSNAWAFVRPFDLIMWCVTGISFIVVGVVVWIMEHRLNDEFRGPLHKQAKTILWFSCSTWFFLHRQNIVSTLARIVLLAWLFAILIIKSSYTASLTSVLMVRQFSSPVKGIDSLVHSKDPIGYQDGSYAFNYLHEQLNIPKSRLVPLKSEKEYAEALRRGPKKGGVAAVVDEAAYMKLFLSTRCDFAIMGQEFTKSGWGFAFPRDSTLAVDLSTSILKLSENGDLQRFHDKWLTRSSCRSIDTKLAVDRLQLKSFWGLFLISGIVFLLALCVYFTLLPRRLVHHSPLETAGSSGQTSRSSCLNTFIQPANEKEKVNSSNSKKRRLEKAVR